MFFYFGELDKTKNTIIFLNWTYNLFFIPPEMLFFLYFSNKCTHKRYILLYFFPVTLTMLETHHLLDSRKEPVPDLCKEQTLPRKVIWTFSPMVLRNIKVLSKRGIWKVKKNMSWVGFELRTSCIVKPVCPWRPPIDL